MRRLMLMLLLLLCATGCSSSSTLHVYNDTGQDLTLTVGSETLKLSVEEAHKNFDVALKSGTKITAVGAKGEKDEVTVTSSEVGRDVIYNVGGKAPLYIVDYTGCYTKEGETAPNPPFKIAVDLSGKKLAAAPAGTLVDAHEMFPAEIIGAGAHVYRLESIPPSLATHGPDAYIAQVLATELKMRGHLYRK